ncbi:hypothetical protein F4813DRAFT_375251 [Daldinia decipiens]|uniref:uncharacterized protein n=1 Tax=Daldinia decipiens TaxID=326647 RepID=UPI0020C52F2F|nr:uncharacterized protein F4813DRAFT_375251 [Daldinia decipiens]KAI1653263.1 hypothetical protein F4813DRAFT_375251 [Daldinia decipiens]
MRRISSLWLMALQSGIQDGRSPPCFSTKVSAKYVKASSCCYNVLNDLSINPRGCHTTIGGDAEADRYKTNKCICKS